MVDVGLVHRKDYRTTIGPRQRGRALREGRNLVLRWELPAGVTLRRVRDHLEELEQRCDAGLACRLERGRLHMEVSRHPLPPRVDFGAFYAAPWAAGELPVGLGRSRSGWLWVDLAVLPHLLIGGASGQGKSVFLRQVLTWLALRFQPAQVRLLLLDLKGGLALSRFGRLPHALRPVVSDVLEAPAALLEVREEMQRRQALMEAANAEDIDDWHEAGRERLPRVIAVVDELAQLSMGALGGKENDEARAAQKRAVGLLCELGRLGRGLGVHLILGTQRPDADAIPGQLKAVCGGTVAFRVRNISNSQILLDCDRAALLPSIRGGRCGRTRAWRSFRASSSTTRRASVCSRSGGCATATLPTSRVRVGCRGGGRRRRPGRPPGASPRCATFVSLRRPGWAGSASCSSPPAPPSAGACRDHAPPGVQGAVPLRRTRVTAPSCSTSSSPTTRSARTPRPPPPPCRPHRLPGRRCASRPGTTRTGATRRSC